MPSESQDKQALEVFFSYAQEDEELRNRLAKHLSILERQGVISAWHDRQIGAGKEWAGEISEHLESAQIILLLVSADFLASDYCYDIEMKRALERHEAREAQVIPVILKPVDWQCAPFAKLQALPKNGKPVTSWENLDEALTDIVKGVRRVIGNSTSEPFTRDEDIQVTIGGPITDRVRMTYPCYTSSGVENRELPFVIGVLAPLSGSQCSKPLTERRFITITRDTLDRVLKGVASHLNFTVPWALGTNGDMLSVNLRFEKLSDFDPIGVASQIPALSELLETRDSLVYLLSVMTADLEYEIHRFLDDESLMAAFCTKLKVPTNHEDHAEKSKCEEELTEIAEWEETPLRFDDSAAFVIIRETFGKHKDARNPYTTHAIGKWVAYVGTSDPVLQTTMHASITAVIDDIDSKISSQLNQVLHHDDYQRLESIWRGLHYLLTARHIQNSVKIKILDVRKDELADDLQKEDSIIFQRVYDDEYKTLFGEPFAILIGDYTFSAAKEDKALLHNLSNLCAFAHLPFIAGVHPELFGVQKFVDLNRRRNLRLLFDTNAYAAWRSLQEYQNASHIALVLPRILLRRPYINEGSSLGTFRFTESVDEQSAETFLWGTAAYALAKCLANAFAKHGWCAVVTGMKGGTVCKLPVHVYESQQGDRQQIGPTDLLVTESLEMELSEMGFIVLCQRRHSDTAVFFDLRSIQRPYASRNDEDSKAGAYWSTRLDYLLPIWRFAHYLQVMVREKANEFESPSSLAQFLQNWLSQYSSTNPLKGDMRFRYPLGAASVAVTDATSGICHLRVAIQPQLQLYEVTGTLNPPMNHINIRIQR